jgi:hypothetical protein
MAKHRCIEFKRQVAQEYASRSRVGSWLISKWAIRRHTALDVQEHSVAGRVLIGVRPDPL